LFPEQEILFPAQEMFSVLRNPFRIKILKKGCSPSLFYITNPYLCKNQLRHKETTKIIINIIMTMKKSFILLTLLFLLGASHSWAEEVVTTYDFSTGTAGTTPTIGSSAHHKAGNSQNVFLATDDICKSRFCFQGVSTGDHVFDYANGKLQNLKGDRWWSIVDLKAGDKIVITFSVLNAGSSTDKHFTVENAGSSSTTNLSLTSGGDAIAANTDMASGTAYYVLADGYVDFKTRKNFYLSKVVITRTIVAGDEPAETSVTPTSATLSVGQTTTLTGAFLGGTFEGEWVSDNESVATVSNAGVVTAIAAGTANITYQWKNDQSKDAYKATAVITVIDKPIGTTVSPTTATVVVGKTTTLTGSFTAGAFTGEWVSDNTDIATVSDAGVVTGVSEGTAHITYQWVDDQSEDAYKATATVTVVEAFDPSALALVKTYDFANWGATTLAIETTAAGKIWNAAQTKTTNNEVFRCTNDGLTSIAIQQVLSSNKGWTINNDGLYEGSGAGRCAAVCDLTEGMYIEFIHNSTTEFYTRNNGEDDGATKIPLVEESNHHVYKVTEDGMVGFELVKGHYVSKINIYKKKTGTPTSLSFSVTAAEASLGEDFTEPTLTKDPADLEGVVFSSSNTSVATVDAETGEVTLKAEGETTITATFEDTEELNGSTASYKLTVTDPNKKDVTATFAFDSGEAGQTATFSIDNVFSVSSVSVADMTYAGVGSDQGITGTKMQPVSQASDNKSQYVKFVVTPKKGIVFTPTHIEFDAMRWGTDGDKKLHYYAESGSTSTELGNVNPNRNGKGNGWSHYSHNISGINATKDDPFTLACYVYGLANTKQISFANVVITGTYSGEAEEETMFTVTTSVTPEGAGSIDQTPTGTSLAEGTSISFTPVANTGYAFLNKWTVNGTEEEGATYTINSLAENTTVVAQFKQLFAVNYDLTAEGVEKGTVSNVLTTAYANVNDKFTAPQNLYLTKNGCTFVKWTDGTNDYIPGTEYTLTADITLQPVFAENTQSLAKSVASTNVTWNFRSSVAAFNIEGKTGYYVQQVQVNGESLDIALAIDATNGKLNNVGRTDAFAQANDGTVLTIPAISGMQVEIANVSTAFKTEGKTATTIAGSEDYTLSSDNKTATYTYTGSDATIDIAIGGDIRYISTISVTYPQTHTYVDVTSAGYRTFASSKALDFTGGVEGLTAYKATATTKKVSFDPIDGAVPAGEGMLLKANEGRYYIPIAVGTPDAIENAFVGVLAETVVEDAGIFVLMKKNDVVGFYKTTTAFTVGAHTAYLPAGIATGRSFIGFDDETTGIKTIENGQLGMEDSVYDLQGRKLNAQPDSQLRKGLYIINGKKVVMK
jgi:uncharacterized protein YjdB